MYPNAIRAVYINAFCTIIVAHYIKYSKEYLILLHSNVCGKALIFTSNDYVTTFPKALTCGGRSNM
jgi:hypothetical protein